MDRDVPAVLRYRRERSVLEADPAAAGQAGSSGYSRAPYQSPAMAAPPDVTVLSVEIILWGDSVVPSWFWCVGGHILWSGGERHHRMQKQKGIADATRTVHATRDLCPGPGK